MTKTPTPTHGIKLGGAYGAAHGGYMATCYCGFTCREKPTAAEAEAAVAAHIARAA